MKATLISVVLLIGASPCAGQTLGVYADSSCTSTCFEVPEFPIFNAYVAFQPGPELEASIGFEFQLSDLPAHWLILSVTPHPEANLVLGDPFDATAIAFPSPRADPCLILYTIRILAALPPVSNHVVEVQPRYPCGDPFWLCCPRGVDETYSLVCLAPAHGVINPVDGCTVGVESMTWSNVKSAYR